MRGRRGLFSLFTSLPEHPEDKPNDHNGPMRSRRRRRHSSGDRETWSYKVEYFFASLGYAVGLGNIWRFPYLCYRNGGGAFLIPYLLALVCVGFPMVFLEMAFGQFASLGAITIWRVCPLFKGIGYATLIVILLVNVYYNVLIAYSLFYLFASITDRLPWASCDNRWNTKYCVIQRQDFSELLRSTADNVTESVTASLVNMTTTAASTTEEVTRSLLKTPTEEFFENHLLKKSTGIHDLGAVQWPLIVCLAVSWFTCFMCLFKGIKSMGKAVIFTTMFSYLILTVLLIRGVTLPGAREGIIFYLKPDFSKLGEVSVWGEASAQMFASLTLGGGGWITLSSYNKFNNRCSRDAILVGIGNALTSIYSGFVIFSVLGYMAHIKGVSVEGVTAKGPGLAFVAYPEGLAMIPGAPFWSVCFFFMMFTVGLDSLFGQVETLAAGIIDEYPEYLRPRRKLFTLFLCIIMFFLGIPLITQGGIYLVTLLDWYVLLLSLTIICLFEVLVIMWIYSYNRFAEDIEMMVGRRPNIYYQVTWRFVCPILLLCVIAFLCSKNIPAQYGNYIFPDWALSIGWAMALLPVTLIPMTMVVQFLRTIGNFARCKGLFQEEDIRGDIKSRLICPDPDWGPALPEIRRKFSYDIKHGFPDGDELLTDDRAAELKTLNTSEGGDGDGMPAPRESQVTFSLDNEQKNEKKEEKEENQEKGDTKA